MARRSVFPRPGSGIRHERGKPGTLGAYCVTEEGAISLLGAAHVLALEPGGDAKEGDPIRAYPSGLTPPSPKTVRVDSLNREFAIRGIPLSSLRVAGIAEERPAVLKRPGEAKVGMRVVKSGMGTGVTYGTIKDTNGTVCVQFKNGKKARFIDQIVTDSMAKGGDSGALLLNSKTYEPLGLLVADNKLLTYYGKLTHVCQKLGLRGVFCPVSLPQDCPEHIAAILTGLVWDGLYYQLDSVQHKSTEEIFQDLRCEIRVDDNSRYAVRYEDCFSVDMPFVDSDLGNLLTTDGNKAVGVIVGGSNGVCTVIPIRRLLKAFDLEIIVYGRTH